ncbi:hypothetical protein [Saccharothrix deserti]|uniref:hypothetical protein n=1 Tax=Saccharothrix deserti TaxID=2593674 RepID=UPI00131B446C|nr:hypothetical protein [Saccharothrix deserti]
MISNVRRAHFGTAVDARTREADAITLPRLVDAGAHPRPSTIGSTYVEHEYAALMDEQREAWAAWGEERARAHDARAHSLRLKTTSLQFLLAEAGREVQAARTAYEHAARLLMSYVRREPGTKLRYWLGWLVLICGDTAGVWAAAVMNGDVPYIAFGQALAAGFAAACAGLVGTELKDMRLALTRQREPETLTEDERLYRRLFTAPTAGTRVIKLVGLLSASSLSASSHSVPASMAASPAPPSACWRLELLWHRACSVTRQPTR